MYEKKSFYTCSFWSWFSISSLWPLRSLKIKKIKTDYQSTATSADIMHWKTWVYPLSRRSWGTIMSRGTLRRHQMDSSVKPQIMELICYRKLKWDSANLFSWFPSWASRTPGTSGTLPEEKQVWDQTQEAASDRRGKTSVIYVTWGDATFFKCVQIVSTVYENVPEHCVFSHDTCH